MKSTSEPIPPEVATAWHEAGHAAMALALGRPVKQVSVAPNHLRLGQCKLNKGTFGPGKDGLETEILILLAGMAAEARHTGVYDVGAASQDLRVVRTLARQRAASPRQVERFERRMLDKTEHLLGDAGVWLAVTRIADELLKHTTISGRAAQHLFELAERDAERDE